jgi:hypothetical protein
MAEAKRNELFSYHIPGVDGNRALNGLDINNKFGQTVLNSLFETERGSARGMLGRLRRPLLSVMSAAM